MKENVITAGVVCAVVFGGAGLYIGMKVAPGALATKGQFPQGMGAASFAERTGGRAGSEGPNAVFGTILSKDANSITVEIGEPGATSTNGASTGSRIVLFDSTTDIMKTVAGSASDLSVGESVSVAGTPNADGSVTAKSIQLRSEARRDR